MNPRALLLLLFTIPSLVYAQHWSSIKNDKTKNFFEKQQAFEEYWEGKEYEKGKGYKQFKRWEWFWEQRVSETGEFPAASHNWEEYKRFTKETKSNSQGKSNADWNPLGPYQMDFAQSSPGVGRCAEVAEDPNNQNIIYVGTPGGGLWKSLNGGSAWFPLTDHLPSLGVSGILVDPVNTNIIYIATGDGDADDTYSIGVLKSLDGGFTWQETGLSWSIPSMRVSHKLLMDPTDNNTLIVATDEGLWKSTNAGDSWYQVLNGDIEDVEYHPTNPSIMYANGSTFYRSTDGGENFTGGADGIPSSSDVSRYSTAVSADEPDWVYLLAGDDDSQGFLGLYRSEDQGLTFELRADSPNLLGWSSDGSDVGGQAWYDLALEVDPDNADRVFVGGVNLWRSNTGGSSWSIRAHWVYPSVTGTYVHADIHDLKYIGSRFYCLSDGGIYRSANDGSSFSDLTPGLAISQFYRIGTSATDEDFILAGAQDNGTIRMQNGSTGQIYGGDGMNCLIHPTNTNRYFVSTQYGNINRTNNGGDSFQNWVSGIPESGAWVTPYMLDPNDSNTLYVGYQSLWKRTGGGSWSSLSPSSGSITAFQIAPSDSDVIYVVRSTTVQKTDDGGNTWTNMQIGSAGATKTSIAVNPTDADEAYITLSGFNTGSKVYKTVDGGDTWENISYNLPNFPANTIVYEAGSNGGLYVGMDVGIYYINDDLVNWIPFNDGLPNMPVMELEIHYATDQVRAATYGRGVWESDLFTSLSAAPEADFVVSKEIACVGEELTFTDFSINHSPGWDWQFEGGSPTSSVDQNPSVTYNVAGTYDVSLSVDNPIGTGVELKTEFITVLSDVGEEVPFVEGFEDIGGLENSDRWFIENLDNDLTWAVNEDYGFGSPSCLWVNNFNNAFDRKDRLYSTTIDLSGVEDAEITMDVAFAQRTEDDKDKLRVYASTDCGNDWDLKKTFSGHTSLHSVDPMDEEFFPAGEGEWHNLVVNNLNEDDLVEGFRFYLYFENDGGNNLFVDNINLSFISTGLIDPDLNNLDMQLFPNPSNGEGLLSFFLLGDRDVTLSIVDVTGRSVKTESLGTLGFGEQRLNIDATDLRAGMYTVELSVDAKSAQVKWLID